ncbi:MAG: hypothetical protein M4579_003447 [Chaenotheca gracillima]|nr:MAG: hypothetical protein M4579_003447 [Chaenotheca gracillima]
MVSLTEVQASNARIASALPARLVAVFVGATSGIGETSLKQFAKSAREPRVYFVGRSQEAGDRITAECKALNSSGEYTFIKGDTSLIRVVDDICRDIKSRETSINLLFLSTGTLIFRTKTSEGLQVATSLLHYSRARFIQNFLPLLQRATALRRVVTVLAAGTEGPVDTNDFQGWNIPLMAARGHGSSLVTFSLEAFAKQAPEVSFIHVHPGPVKTGIARGTSGALMTTMKVVFTVLGPLVNMDLEECGERHVYLATSARYPPAVGGDAASGVPLGKGVAVVRGTIGKSGSGVYAIDKSGDSVGPKMEENLAKLRQGGLADTIWAHTQEEYKRIEGLEVK